MTGLRKVKRVQRKMPRIKFRQELFWDVDPETIDPKKHAQYVIERILDFGNTNEIRWMHKYYPHRLMSSVVKNSRVLDPKSKSLWELVYR